MLVDDLSKKLDKLLKTEHLKFEGFCNESMKEIESIATELSTIKDVKTSVNSLDQLFFDIVKRTGSKTSTLKALLSLYRAAGPNPNDLITWNLRRFSLSYAALSLTVPELFDELGNDNSYSELIEVFLTRNPNLYASFFQDCYEILDSEAFEMLLSGLCGAVIKHMNDSKGTDKLSLMTSDVPNIIISILGPMVQVRAIVQFLVDKRSGFFQAEPAFTGPKEAEEKSLVGAIWSAIAVDAPDNFDALKALLPPDYAPPIPQNILLSAFQSLRDSSDLAFTSLHENFLLPIIKSDATNRQVVLKHLAALAALNANRAKLQADRATINSDGFVMGVFAVLLKFCDPFTLVDVSVKEAKLGLIDYNFLIKNDLIDWTDVGRCGMDPKEFEAFEATARVEGDCNFNFITQIFFLSLRFFQLGPLRLIQEYGTSSREFIEIEQELKRLEETRTTWSSMPNALMIQRFIEKMKGRMRELVDLRLSHDFHLMNPSGKKSSMALLAFFLSYYKSLSTDGLKQRALPEFFLENAWEYLLFMSRIDGDLSAASSREKDEILALAAELVPCGDLIKNPYIRAKQVELFFSLVMTEEERHNGVFSNLDDVVHKRLIPNCMKFYVQVEALGTSTAFYDKFSIRYHLTKILLKLLALKPNAFALPQLEQTIDDGNLVRFINLCVSDSTYLLDESLSKLSEIKEKQSQTEPLSAEEQKLLSQTERQCQSLLALGNESLSFLARLTSAIPAAFLRSEILDRLTAMLNFNLVLLAGPRCSKLKVSNPGKYNFNPRALLASLIEIYLSLSGEESFIKSVAGDERSFSTQLFDSCVGIMRRTGMSVEMIDSFTCLSEKIISHLGKDSHDASGAGISGDLSDQENIPDEFLDPILFNVMVDPVRLPASQMVVDRSTIQAHLLNDPHDPFNRQVLTIEQVEPMPELKAQIEAFIKSTQLK